MTIEFTRTEPTQPVPAEQRTELLINPGFGRVFTDHMVTITWTPDAGWHNAGLRPYGPLALDPATAVFHYGQSIFEGFKAYVQPDGSIKTFRPDANGRRFQRSAERLALPQLPVEDFVAAADLLIEADRAWVPKKSRWPSARRSRHLTNRTQRFAAATSSAVCRRRSWSALLRFVRRSTSR